MDQTILQHYQTKGEIVNNKKEEFKQELFFTLLKIGLLTYFGAVVLTTGVLFTINLSDNSDPNYSALYLLLLISYFFAGIISANRCGQYTKTIFGTVFKPIAIAITFAIVLLVWYSFIPVASLVADLGEKFLQLRLSVPENEQGFRGLTINALITFVIGWGISATRS